jgi:type IV secretory pathway ATPase VirB11/archaellum biosynthesis ATPase
MTGLGNDLLAQALKTLSVYYERPGIEEVAINRPNEIWIKDGKGWVAEAAPEVTFKYVISLCRVLANVTEQDFDKDRIPILSATLPGGHRFQAVIGPNVRYDISDTHGVAVCIRCFKKEKKFSLADYKLNPGEELMPMPETSVKRRKYAETPFEDLVGAVEHGEAVLISGATSTGKTTFLNALVEYIPPDRRIITVEDTREVLLPHINRVHLVVSRTGAANQVNYSHILDSVVRLTPDAIICGEVSVGNVKSIYRLMTTGHSNFFATIHAESPQMAIKAFWQNLSQNDMNLDPKAAIEIISMAFGRIVQIDRSSGDRIITGVEVPDMVEQVLKDVIR